ncbi:pre-B-cell leukemia homeobox interacting protein 1b isoform X2 [Conger conger]|uniref:pre-B-cell leukemia homeobox interacting protein 1b isoform X2 n=1 Tax=Conger conger TaxID=82655 RepID=UPI002A5A1437|nr:pre-B-cell leukemia homeobox interacting protein 1b isoform X2 [Conger conger]XP_061108024.1 pre-B-cell leukemia homeobox interacting protein 1b isoform X2 [Conger conger]
MSDSSNITDSNSSSNNWTVFPTEPAVGNVGPGAEGSESLTAAPSLALRETGKETEKLTDDSAAGMEEVHPEQGLQEPAVENIGPEAEVKAGLADTPVSAQEVTGAETGGGAAQTEDVRSEEGLQVCQETAPESNDGSTPPSPTLLSPSPSFGCHPEGYSHISHEPETFSDTYTHVSSSPESHIPISPDSHGGAGLQQEEEGSELARKVSDVGKQAVQLVDQLVKDMFHIWERKLTRRGISELPYDSELGAEQGPEGEGLRKRKVFPIGPLDELGREGDEVEEDNRLRPREGDEDGGFTLNKCILGALLLLGIGTIVFSGVFTDLDDAEDVHTRELSETELQGNQAFQSAEAEPQGAQEMAELLDKLAKENQQISDLQTQLQTQKEELNLALQQAEEKGRESVRSGELERENEKMKEELSSLPALQSELESLRARVTELTLLTAKEDSQEAPIAASALPPSDQTENSTQTPAVGEEAGATEEKSQAGSLEEELERQKVLLEGSRKRLEGMKAEEGGKKGVREGLVEMERRLTEQVEKLGKRGGEKGKRPWEAGSERAEQGKEWRGEKEAHGRRNGGRDGGREKEPRNEWRGEKDWKEGGERGRGADRVWKEMEERKERRAEKDWKREWHGGRNEGKERKQKERKEQAGEKEWKAGRDGERGGKDWKPREEEKEKGWYKNWERKKDGWKEERKPHSKEGHHKHEESRNGREGVGEQKEKAKKDRHWQGTADKTPLDPSHRHHEHNQYWKRKREKLQHFYRPLVQCHGIAECAKVEGLAPVQLSDFEALLAGYLSKMEAAGVGGGEEIGKLVKDFFVDGVFTHDKISFRDFVEDLADILEDMVEGEGEDNDEMEDEMEAFEKEALRLFSVGVVERGGEGEDLRAG